jgi:multidrug efflux pump
MQVSAPEGTAFDYMDRYIDRLSEFIMDFSSGKKNSFAYTSPGFSGGGAANSGFVRITLVDQGNAPGLNRRL